MATRRPRRECGESGWAELPKAHRTREARLYRADHSPDSYLHDYLQGRVPRVSGPSDALPVPPRERR
ncbi:hypothetical protein [Amycolatopsis kentuckyensis]|uniref:hypothetical protein n=1 Tax=Amycolatopsis kentuckyensis TaxID=218823 RepID=UPI0011787886|nr:hypothetical protein [Amycolatopsis kentuckyensis]